MRKYSSERMLIAVVISSGFLLMLPMIGRFFDAPSVATISFMDGNDDCDDGNDDCDDNDDNEDTCPSSGCGRCENMSKFSDKCTSESCKHNDHKCIRNATDAFGDPNSSTTKGTKTTYYNDKGIKSHEIHTGEGTQTHEFENEDGTKHKCDNHKHPYEIHKGSSQCCGYLRKEDAKCLHSSD